MKMTTGLELLLIVTLGLMGCTSTAGNNTNLRNTNTNTGYMTNATPSPVSPMNNSSLMGNVGNNMKSGPNMNSNMNSKMNTNGKRK